MEPRNAATVTVPELVKAFEEGRGVENSTSDDSSTARYYVLFKKNDEITRADFGLTELQGMLALVATFFATGAQAVAISVHETPPDGWEDYTPISAG